MAYFGPLIKTLLFVDIVIYAKPNIVFIKTYL